MVINKQLFAAAFCVLTSFGSPALASTWTQQQEIPAPPGAVSGNTFGYAVAVSGNTAVIGAYLAPMGTLRRGAAYIFVRSGGVWTKTQVLRASDVVPHDHFGQVVSVDGDTAVIGATGAAYVFVRSNGVWTQQQKLTASDAAAGDGFGSAVSVSGDTALIGAGRKNVDSHISEGAAYVFVRSGGAWTQQQELNESGAQEDYFGWSVSLSGDTALIGAFGKSNISPYQGTAFVFVRNGDVWTRQQKLTAADGAEYDQFGYSVSLSGDTALIGAYKNSLTPQAYGAAYVFVRSGGVWTQQQELTASGPSVPGAYFGGSLSLSGDTALIGAYVFTGSGETWTQQQVLMPPDGATQGYFGISVSLSGSTAVIGEYMGQGGAGGATYVFVQK
jgi:hypothetical protein